MLDVMDRIAILRQFAARRPVVPCGHVADATRLEATTSAICICSRCDQAFVVPPRQA